LVWRIVREMAQWERVIGLFVSAVSTDFWPPNQR